MDLDTVNADEIEQAIIAIIERAEYAGRRQTEAILTRSNRKAREAREQADAAQKIARHSARVLAERLAR